MPGEQQAGPGDGGQVRGLPGGAVGVKGEAAGVVALQQHRPGPRAAIAGDRCQHHGGRLRQARGRRIGQPAGELGDRVTGQRGLFQGSFLVAGRLAGRVIVLPDGIQG